MTSLTGFPRTRWPRRWFSESYAVRISVKISRICEFRVIMGIMTGLLGCCSSSTLGSRANDYVKTLATLGFWLHHSPCSLGCWTNNTLATRSLSPNRIQSICYAYETMTLEAEGRRFGDLVIAGGTKSFQNDSLWCHQWQRGWRVDDLLLSEWFIWIVK